MRLLIVGAGALGGYFGGRLLQAGQDVTFLVRPRRAAQLARTGLVLRSPFGDLSLPAPPVVLATDLGRPYDAILVGCKAYDLAQTMADLAPGLGPDSFLVPMLNGLGHLEQLAQAFGPERVLGGRCLISATLDEDGVILHLNDLHDLSFGELDGSRSPRVQALEQACAQAGFKGHASTHILQEMWEKWVFIAAFASITSLMRASIGEIAAAGATELALAMFEECQGIGALNGFPPRPAASEFARAFLSDPHSPLTASMAKDIERGAPIEAEHLVGDLLRRGPAGDPHSLLRIAYAHLQAYQARSARFRQAP